MTRAAFRTLIEEIASVEPGALRDTDTRGTVKDWSSLVDVQIMAVIASELGLGEEAETLAYETVGELLDHLEERGAFSAI
jgi:acyl carrier protein